MLCPRCGSDSLFLVRRDNKSQYDCMIPTCKYRKGNRKGNSKEFEIVEYHSTFVGDVGSGEPVELAFVQAGPKRRRRGVRGGKKRRLIARAMAEAATAAKAESETAGVAPGGDA